jgi:hypothetical protein
MRLHANKTLFGAGITQHHSLRALAMVLSSKCPLISAALGIALAVLTFAVGFVPACCLLAIAVNVMIGNRLWGTADMSRTITSGPLRLLYLWLRGCAVCLSQCGFAANCAAAHILDKCVQQRARVDLADADAVPSVEVAERHVGGYVPPHARGRSTVGGPAAPAPAPAPVAPVAPAVFAAVASADAAAGVGGTADADSDTDSDLDSDTATHTQHMQSPSTLRRRHRVQSSEPSEATAATPVPPAPPAPPATSVTPEASVSP